MEINFKGLSFVVDHNDYQEFWDNFNNWENKDLNFVIEEGSITKINKIIINGNKEILAQEIKSIIKSKTKSIRNIFANNNFKPSTVERDKFLISNYYKNNGFLDVNVETQIEYLKSNKVNIYFIINEGEIFSLSSLRIIDENNILKPRVIDYINDKIDTFLLNSEDVNIKENFKFKEIIMKD